MSESNRSTIAVNKLVLVLLGFIILALAGVAGFMYGQVKSLEKWVLSINIAQPTSVQQTAMPTALVDIGTVKAVFDLNVVKFGDKNRKLLVVEVSDPSCPYCHVAGGNDPEIASQIGPRFTYASEGGTYQPPVLEIRKLVDSGEASYAFVYYPGHSSGEMAAKALYCAFDQGKFWPAHDLLYSYQGYNLLNDTVHNDKANSGILADFLKEAVDVTALKACLDSGKYDSRLIDETKLAETSLLDLQEGGTPTYIINMTRFNGAYSWDTMRSVVDAALK
jgi:protein-disulfide isomerase